MRHEINHNPSSAVLHVLFERPGEQLITEGGALVRRDAAIDAKTNLRGEIGVLRRRLTAGEGLFQTTFTATAPMQTIWIAPAAEGSIECLTLHPGMEVFLQSAAYLASTPGISLDTRWQGEKRLFAAGLFLIRAYGQGLVWFSSYGGIHAIDIGREHDGYLCESTHLVAFTTGLQYRLRKLGGLRGPLFSEEGLIYELRGHGRAWLQTRNPGALAAFLHPFRPVGGEGGSTEG